MTGVNTGERIELGIKKSSSNYMRTANSRDYSVLDLVISSMQALPFPYHSGNNPCFKLSFPQICITSSHSTVFDLLLLTPPILGGTESYQ